MESEIAESVQKDIVLLNDEPSTKKRLETKALISLESRLEDRDVSCHKCNGCGATNDGKMCTKCYGVGIVHERADFRAIEMVLAPKFPKTTVSLTGQIDSMSKDDLFAMIDGLT